MRIQKLLSIFPIGCAILLTACGDRVAKPLRLNYELVASNPHDTAASTQGLLLYNGFYYESTGGYGTSTLRRVDPDSGKVLQRRHLPAQAFGEGLSLREGRLYQLEWKGGKGFIYNRATFDLVGDFRYGGEGWGLVWDGKHFILSDGTATLRFLDPDSFVVVRSMTVRDHRGPVDSLNELEFVEGKLYANRWHDDNIYVINPQSGIVEATLDLSALEQPRPRYAESVLNGIAYDPNTGFLHVTGKRWSQIYILRLLF